MYKVTLIHVVHGPMVAYRTDSLRAAMEQLADWRESPGFDASFEVTLADRPWWLPSLGSVVSYES